MMAKTRLWFAAETVRPMLPKMPAGMPGLWLMFGPRVATVGRLEDAAAFAARVEHPRRAARLPERGVDDVRIRGIEGEVGGARRVVPEQHLAPVLPAISAAIHTALRRRRPDVALRGDVNDIRVGRVHEHARDLSRELQSERRPRLSGVGRLPDTFAVGHVAAQRVFTTADIDDVRARRRDGDGADRPTEILVRDGRPGLSAVEGLEHAAAGGPHVVLVRSRRRPSDRDGPAATKGAKLPPLQRVERSGVDRGFTPKLGSVQRNAGTDVVGWRGGFALRVREGWKSEDDDCNVATDQAGLRQEASAEVGTPQIGAQVLRQVPLSASVPRDCLAANACATNNAGDGVLPSPALVYRSVRALWPSVRCTGYPVPDTPVRSQPFFRAQSYASVPRPLRSTRSRPPALPRGSPNDS